MTTEWKMPRSSLRDALAWRTRKTATCWIWVGSMTTSGYGRLQYRGVAYRAHRAAYMLAKGPIPDGLVIDHLCRVTKCVNPDHLEAVTDQVNVLRGISPAARNAVATHCIRDHPLAGGNLYVDPQGTRKCRECKNESGRRRRAPARDAA